MRSRVTSNCLPTSSSVWSVFMSLPKRIRSTLASRGVSDARISCVASDSDCEVADSCGETAAVRSEEHTSELQSLMRISYAVFCLKKNNNHPYLIYSHVVL